jgi:glc operon protein GlcG
MEKIIKLIAAAEKLIPEYLANPEDAAISGGGSAICIIDEDNNVFGKLFGTDKIRCRQCYKIAWIKASQVWITGYKTGEFEKLAYSGQIDEKQFGIIRPDYLGWEGGQPVSLKDGTKLSIGFSGFRGTSDLEIVVRAISNAGL